MKNTRRLWVMRHGRSLANEAGLIVSDLERGRDHYGLTEEGRKQVIRTATEARDNGVLPNNLRIISSPLLRAKQSAAIAAQLLDIADVHVDERLRERYFGELEGMDDSHYPAVWEHDRIDADHHQWQVESVIQVWARLQELLSECTPDPTLLVAHGDVASTLLCGTAGEDLRKHREIGPLETAGFAEVIFKIPKP